MLKTLLAMGSIVFAGGLHAQAVPRPALGKTAEVQGLVTVSDGTGVTRVLTNNSVIDRSRYVTSSSGTVTLKFNNGCTLTLKPNQTLAIEAEKNCDDLVASIQTLGNPGGAAFMGSGGAGSTWGTLVIGGAGLVLLRDPGRGPALTGPGGGSTPGGGGTTPGDGGTTPGGGGTTPGGGGTTPGGGGTTPGGGGTTPGGGGGGGGIPISGQ